jgi:hypothetical protein
LAYNERNRACDLENAHQFLKLGLGQLRIGDPLYASTAELSGIACGHCFAKLVVTTFTAIHYGARRVAGQVERTARAAGATGATGATGAD